MIEFSFATPFDLKDTEALKQWISTVIAAEGYELGEIGFVFCDDEYLHNLNMEFLDHDTLTDIISFDYRMGNQINGELYISVERVEDNAEVYGVPFTKELHRVMVHGVFHCCGYNDKSEEEKRLMRRKEDWALALLDLDYPEN